MSKIIVKVLAEYEVDGRIIPKAIIWDDGRIFEIDRVSDVRMAASLKAGGVGLRYTCRIRNKELYLFLEETKWFVEGRDRDVR